MLDPVKQKYPHLAAVVRQSAKASPGKSPMMTVGTGLVNVRDVVHNLSWTGFFTHLSILVEVGVYKNPIYAFFGEVFSLGGSRRVDVYKCVLENAGYQIESTSTPTAGSKETKPECKQSQKIKSLLAEIDQKMSEARRKLRMPVRPTPLPSNPDVPRFPATEKPKSNLAEDAISNPAKLEPPPAPKPANVPVSMPASPPPEVGPDLMPMEPARPMTGPVSISSMLDDKGVASITSLTCNGTYDAGKGCVIFTGANGKKIEIPCIDGVLDLGKFSGLTELDVNNCPIIRSIKFPGPGILLDMITINGCKNLSGDIDISSCVNVSDVNIVNVGKICVIIPSGDTFSSLYIKNCQDPEVITTANNDSLEITFENCEFSQDVVNKMQQLNTRCQVIGLPRPDPMPVRDPLPLHVPVHEVRLPDVGARDRTPAADDAKLSAGERAVPVGIQNQGASCYAASLMQLLFQNKQFRQTISELCKRIPCNDNHQKLLHCINDIFTHLQSGTGACPRESMQKFLQLEKNLGFANAFMQDDSTLLRKDVIENLRRLLACTDGVEISALAARLLPGFQKYRTVDSPDGKKTYFGGPIGPGERAIEVRPEAGSLDAALEEYFSTRELTGADQYYNRRTKERVDARESTRISGEPPEVLTIDVMRVRYDYDRQTQVKNGSPFTFPARIDIQKHTTNPGRGPCMFELNSVVAHSGTAGGGHYIAYVKRNEQWYECNDSSVRQVSWSDIEKLFNGSGGFHATMLSYAKF
ncbi:MAG: hypothetical protein LBF26_03560 [Puniceicoccales bacterium]|jgi:ubiquitin C-terminal hydrolase|nr:hypothetical protein [Puniceicoccales bacterium]